MTVELEHERREDAELEPELQKRRMGVARAEEGAGEVEEYWNHNNGAPSAASAGSFALRPPVPVAGARALATEPLLLTKWSGLP